MESSDDEFEQWERQYEYARDEQEIAPGYEAAQSRLRLSMTCRDMVRPVPGTLDLRIIELAEFIAS